MLFLKQVKDYDNLSSQESISEILKGENASCEIILFLKSVFIYYIKAYVPLGFQ